MNVDDIARALKGANITINIQGGTNNTMYTAPVQVNNHKEQRTLRDRFRCPKCGYTSNDAWDYAGGMCRACWQLKCIEREEQKRRELSSWQVINSRSALEDDDDDEPLQIEAPPVEPEQEIVWIRDDPAKYAGMERPYYVPLVRR